MDEFEALVEPIAFASHEDITSRPQWRASLDPRQHRLARILGDYHFPKSLEWSCGLSTCRQVHQKGFVVQTEDGLETHIGKDCGVNHFQLVSWEAERARFRRAKSDAELRQYLEAALAERYTLEAQMRDQVQALGTLLPELRQVLERISRDPAVQRAFDEVVRAGGAIRKSKTLSLDEANARGLPPGRRTYFETVAQLDGVGAVRPEAIPGAGRRPGPPATRVLFTLRDLLNTTWPRLTRERLAEADAKDREAIAAELRKARELMARAGQSVEEARSFLAPANLHKISLLDLQRVSGRAAKVLAYFAGLGPA